METAMSLTVAIADTPGVRLDDRRGWAVRLGDGDRPEILPEDQVPAEDLLGTFVHFGTWVFRSAAHPAVARLLVDGVSIAPRTTIRLGLAVQLNLVPFSLVPAQIALPAAPAPAPSPGPEGERAWQTIGRVEGDADIKIDDPTLHRIHAQIRPGHDGTWVVVARQGAVFVNGLARSSGPVGLNDALILGQTVLRTADLAAAYGSGPPAVPLSSAGSGLPVQAIGLSVNNGHRPALIDLNFEIAAGSLVAVVGPSGAGKSTLMGVMLGGRRIVGGQLRIGDVQLRPGGRADLLRKLVRLVPQHDHLLPELTVEETLDGAARLRLASDTPGAERAGRVEHVLTDLGLAHRRHARIDQLSGGERRRVSIGVELVGQPSLLLLDEPTSGLDLGKDRALLRTLRTISQGGCTVVVITHSVAHIDDVDQVLILATGGRLAHTGRPADVVDVGRRSGWADLLESLGERAPEKSGRPLLRLPQTLFGRHLTVLLRRGPWYLAGMSLLPLGGAAVAAIAGPEGLRPAPGLAQVLAILVTVAALSGSALSYLDVVGADGMYKRDWRVGAASGRIVLAAFAGYGLLSMVLAAVMVAAFGVRDGFPEKFALPPAAALYLVVFSVFLASMALGLLVSSVVSTVPHAVTVNTSLAIAQVVLNGSLFTLPAWLAPVTLVLPARLGFAAAANYGTLNLQRERADLVTDALWAQDVRRFWLLLAGQAAITVVALGVAALVLRGRWRRNVE